MKKLFLAVRHALAEVLILPIRLYRRLISPLIPPRCRFTPTCSAYAMTAIRRFGIFGGGLMAFCRLVRCQPFCRAGYDPVPETFSLRPFAGARQEEERKNRREAENLSRDPAGVEDTPNV